MCDVITAALGITSAASDAAAIANKAEENRREEQAKKTTNEIRTRTEAEINKQTQQFGNNGDVVTINKKKTTTQPQKRQQLISLRLNNPTETKPVTGTDNNLGLNI